MPSSREYAGTANIITCIIASNATRHAQQQRARLAAHQRLAARRIVGIGAIADRRDAAADRRERPRVARASERTRARRVAKLTRAFDTLGLPREPRLDQPHARAAVSDPRAAAPLHAGRGRPRRRARRPRLRGLTLVLPARRCRPAEPPSCAGGSKARVLRHRSSARRQGSPRSRTCARRRRAGHARAYPAGTPQRSGSSRSATQRASTQPSTRL